jgi:predicted MPP superfamily phosphohydrolase
MMKDLLTCMRIKRRTFVKYAGMSSLGATVLLVHEPDFADIAATTQRIDLQLSGHTHGGQIRIPGYGALLLPHMGKRYQAGLYHVESMLHYTNRGLGMLSPQIRLNCRPEITVFVCL